MASDMPVGASTGRITTIRISGMPDVVHARRQGLEMACELGFALPDATRIAVIISELGRNIVLYADSGTITLSTSTKPRRCFKVVAEDQGPGIENINWALQKGNTSSKGLGLGLTAAKQLMDEFNIVSAPNQGTVIAAVKYLH